MASEVRTQENAIILAAAEKLVSLGSEAAQLMVEGNESDTQTDTGEKILVLFKAYAKKAEMDDAEIDALLYCLRALSEAETFPTTSPIVGQSLIAQIYVNGGALQWFDEGVSVGQGIEEVNLIGAAVSAVKAGNRLNITITGGSSLAVLPADVQLADVDFDFVGNELALFVGDGLISTTKTWNFLNDTAAVKFDFVLEIASGYAQTLPSTVMMNDVRWDSGAKTWEALDTGKYRGSAVWDGTNWFMEISQSVYA